MSTRTKVYRKVYTVVFAPRGFASGRKLWKFYLPICQRNIGRRFFIRSRQQDHTEVVLFLGRSILFRRKRITHNLATAVPVFTCTPMWWLHPAFSKTFLFPNLYNLNSRRKFYGHLLRAVVTHTYCRSHFSQRLRYIRSQKPLLRSASSETFCSLLLWQDWWVMEIEIAWYDGRDIRQKKENAGNERKEI